jgi:glycosyltransferase involved in cell wall biosynthesis
MRSNLTLVNSEYIAGKVRTTHDIEPVVLYPPVPGEMPEVPWEGRTNDFVCVARFNQDKRQDIVMEILDAVRARGHDVRLHLVGSPSREPFAARVQQLARRHATWVTVHQNIPRSDLVALLARSRYGIHGMIGEHFGIAVAELQRAGCVTFASEIGGPREILGSDPRLLFSSTGDAIEKIDRVLRDPEAQRTLHAQALARRDLFTTARFVERFRELVLEFAG